MILASQSIDIFKTGNEMKLDLGTQSVMQDVFNLKPNFNQCFNVKNYGVKVSLFLCDVRILDL